MGDDQTRIEGVRLRYPADVGDAIRAERRNRQMTQAAFAAEMGVSRKWLSEIENGKQTVELGLVLAVFRRLGFNLAVVEKPRAPFDFDAALRSLVGQPATPHSEPPAEPHTTPPSEPHSTPPAEPHSTPPAEPHTTPPAPQEPDIGQPTTPPTEPEEPDE